VSVTTTVSLRNIPLVSLLSVITKTSVSSTNPSALIPVPFPTYTVTLTVSAIWGFRFSSVSDTITNITSRVWYVSTSSVRPWFSNNCNDTLVAISSPNAVSAAVSLVPVTSVYVTCSVSLLPHDRRVFSATGFSVSVSATPTVSLWNIPVVSPLSVSTKVCVSKTRPCAIPPSAYPFPAYTTTVTVSFNCGLRFSSVS
jgi:hypothetical protein